MRLFLGVFALVSMAVAGSDEIHPRTNVIALYSGFVHEAPAAVRAALDDELDAIMGPLGMHFEWRTMQGTNLASPTMELAVITFKGHCDIGGLTVSQHYDPGALGWTHISDGQILPFADVDCGEIRAFLQRALLKLPGNQREDAFGRAIARVLAHELYHIFADTTRHGTCGVAKEAYTVDDLMSSTFRFQDKESRELRNSKAANAVDTVIDPR